MFAFAMILLMVSAPVWIERSMDPAFPLGETPEMLRGLDCVRVDQATAHAIHPDKVPEGSPRAQRLYGENDALLCKRRYLGFDARPARDEAILESLGATVGLLTRNAESFAPPGTLWHVETFYPDVAVASKVAIAARTDLAERGRRVSDRVPMLAAGDISVLFRRPLAEVYPIACARYFAEKSLAPGEALLALMILDPRETELHAGLCLDGKWRWVR